MRNRYLDLLRAAAIVRVIVYHLFGWPWLSILLPAMGIMFALAGSLTAASLDKRPAGQVITSRLRRLLPPLWLLAVVAVPAMLYLGWAGEEGGDEPLSWKLGLWLLPIGDPPGSERGMDVWEPLWYIRAYLWFVVLSPLMYLAYKKMGWAAVAAPIVLIAVLDKTDFTLPFGRADAAMWDFATYGACWIAGFAHHDGRLARIRPGLVVAASATLGLAALYWLRGHADDAGWDLNDVSESQALWSLAFVLLALRWQPDMSWLQRSPRMDGAVNLLNARAVTIYLWHNIAIAAIWPVLTVLTLDDLGELDGPVDLIASIGLTVGAVLAFGWVEDLAARRKPALWPSSPSPAAASSPALPPTSPSPSLSLSLSRSHSSSPSSSSPSPSSSPSATGRDELGSRVTGELGPGGSVSQFAAVGAFETLGSVDPGSERGVETAYGSVDGGAKEVPWAGVAAAPVVVGEAGFAPRRRDYVAPFPEAEVSFGLPDAGSGLSGEDREDGARPARHAAELSEPAISEPSASDASSGPLTSRPVSGVPYSGPHSPGPGAGSRSFGPGSSRPDSFGPGPGPANAGPFGPSEPGGPPAQMRRHDLDDRETAVPWFGGEHDAPR